MNIYYDFQTLLLQKYGGISRYHYELLMHIRKLKLANAKIKCIRSNNQYFEKYFKRKPDRGRGMVKGAFKWVLNCIALIREERRGYDIVHPTYYYVPYVLRKNKGKLFITVHDMIYELFPEMFSKIDPTRKCKKRMIYKADHIIAVSENTKKDILKIYPDIPEEKITVIYHGLSFKYVPPKQDRNPLGDYVLFVGKRKSYKNFFLFFEAMKDVLDSMPELKLLCMGGGAFSSNELEHIGPYIKRVVYMDATDKKLAYAYTNAKCFVFPSLYEGFGIPTLEAFQCGCPVLLSNSSSMPEVGGDAAVYFNPYSKEDMSEKIKMVLSDSNIQEEMRRKGKKQLLKFNWDKTARQVVSCYKRELKADRDKGRKAAGKV